MKANKKANNSDMKTAIYSKGVKKVARRLALSCLLLFFMGGSLMAQNDRHYVIKKIDGSTVHYLSHAGNTLQDATTFGPDCIWYSSNNYNYYFMAGETRKYLKAPLQLDGTLSVADNPGTQTLNNNTLDYFFYDWDHGVARGIRHFDSDCPSEYNSSGSQCWQVVWVSYESNQWKMSHVYGYEPTANSARFLRETETEHGVEISNGSGGMGNLAGFSMTYGTSHPLDGTANSYSYTKTPAYTYYHVEGRVDPSHDTNIPEESYYYYNSTYNSSAPAATPYSNVDPTRYEWSISCDGETQYLSFNETSDVLTASGATPTLYYIHENTTTSHVMATLTLTVTYGTGDAQVTQTRTANVTVKTHCQNPTILPPAITYVGVTLSWLPTADSYEVSWKTGTEDWNSVIVEDTTSYILTGLQFDTEYSYKVKAECSSAGELDVHTFTTLKEPGLVVTGAIFGGGRMADVQGKTEVVIVNCDSIGSIYGGNDIAGTVLGDDGATIMLGVNLGDATYGTYGTTGGAIRVSSVYGGGNGYYTYDGYEPGVEIGTTELTDGQFHYSVTEVGGEESYLTSGVIPTITKTAITVSNDHVKIDSVFGGAKNAFLTTNSGDGSLITIEGGTIMAVFGGNNFGGDQGHGKHHIVVNGTTTCLNPSIVNTATRGYGRDFGIRYLFGGGNKVYGSTTNVEIFGGQCDTIFAGGNAADVYAAQLTVNCAIGTSSDGITYNKLYSNAIQTYDATSGITPKGNYAWDGYTGIYNVRTLFGGNNMATFDSKVNHSVPDITLTSGSVGTVYGGGNAGDMWGLSNDDGTGGSLVINGDIVKYGTHVKMASPYILIDNLYGGCQVSNVRYSTWVELIDGHVGTVYGGCNVSGDVGSTRVDPNAPDIPTSLEEQAVFGGTYVVASGGVVYKNLFAGGNGYYHCLNTYGNYISGLNYTEHNYVGLSSPTHNETHVVVMPGATVKGNVYAGGNLARVGFNNSTVGSNPYPKLVGLTSVRMSGGRVYGSVYGGGNMADVYGSCEVQVSGGTIDKSLYGGNDRLGKVANPASNRIFPDSYNFASDGVTSLTNPKVFTYVGLTGNPTITNVYGGGNGDYAYFTTFEAAQAYIDGGGTKETVVTCDATNQPIQQNTFVDVGVAGGESGAHIGTVYGGGDGVTVIGFITVFLNVKTDPIGFSNVGTIFGGNNKGPLELPADIIMLNGQVNTVYGGCNEGAMDATNFTKTVGDYDDIGSYVRLLSTYDGDGEGGHDAVTPNVKVMDAIYGGCRMNGVTRNSLVLVEGGGFSNALLFGGSDISGHVGGWSRVATVGGTVGNVYGGGNGNYDYVEGGNVYKSGSDHTDENLVATGITAAPTCAQSGADILGGSVGTADLLGAGTVSRVFGAGYGKDTRTTGDVLVNVGRADAASATATPTIYGEIYGGSALGNVNTDESADSHYTTTVNFLNGTLKKATVNEVDYGGNLFGGGLGRKEGEGLSAVPAKVYGKVFVNISNDEQSPANCFIDLREANIYGCNNTNGSPQDDVRVDVWKTAFNFSDYATGDDYTSQNGTNGTGAVYAINQVFGGGNQADYRPVAVGEGQMPHLTHVYIHECLNTIRRVFSGGNAAYAEGVKTTIEGGRFNYVFGGGNGEVNEANIGAGGTNLLVEAGIINHLFGGSNSQGSIAGPVKTEINGTHYVPAGESVTNPCNESITEFFGGSNEAELSTDYGIYSVIKCGAGTIAEAYGGSNMAEIQGNVKLDVRGGTITNVFGGSKGVLNGTAANIDGNVTLNLEGGEITNAFGGSDQNGNITGNITVNVIDYELEDCGLDLTNVYGGGKLTAYNPTNPASTSPVVNVMHIAQEAGIRGNVFGGGMQAAVNANTKVNIGYDANNMSGYLPADLPEGLVPADFRAFVTGKVFGSGDEAGVGIGQTMCSTTVNMYDGTVLTGIYGGTNTSGTVTGNTVVNLFNGTIGESENANASIHGGGYGNATSIAGDVTVNFGDNTDIENTGLVLYGDLYGGSALGSVNTDGSNTTIVNLRNGIIHGAAYGGGLGHVDHNDWGWVKGKVYVRVGDATDPNDHTTYTGQANLVDCDVYGCNNLNGSPQNEVHVDVFKTAHNASNVYENTNGGYAIHQVFGGGNQANYSVDQFKTHVYIHGCNNTIGRVFGGGDAAAVYGTNVEIDGGRFNEMFGGGNGEVSPANVGDGGINIRLHGGLFNVVFNGSNQYGEITGEINYENIDDNVCDNLMILDHFLGSNQADIFGDITATIECSTSPMTYINLYCGCNRAQIYGNINVVIKGGIFENVYGGSKGQREPEPYSADVNIVTQEDIDAHPNEHLVLGKGGNINLTINGGTIGNLFGGGHLNGNVEGKISITVDDKENSCDLFIGNIYGAGSHTSYAPTNPDGISPKVMIHNATVGGHTNDLPINNNSNQGGSDYEGNVFGGGLSGDVTSNPEVIVGNSESSDVTIKGNVYGGGEVGIVDGNAQVVIVPKTHTFTYNSTPSQGQGLIRVLDSRGEVISSGSPFTLGEHMELRIEAFPSVYGYKFDSWTVNGTGASVSSPQSASTTFVMGTDNASVTTSFEPVSTHTLSVNGPGNGNSVVVEDGLGDTVDLTQGISEGAELKITATAAQGYRFVRWDVVEGNGYMSNRYSTSTTFTMGTNNCTITAVFEIEP